MSTPVIDRFSGKYEFLSNFFPCQPGIQLHFGFCGEDVRYYRTIEHAFQASKTLDPEWRTKIYVAAGPGIAKRLGRAAPMRLDWESIRIPVMAEYLRQKFKDRVLAKMLLDTGHTRLVEGNTWGDKFWGVCDGVGQNHLGHLLALVRWELQGKSAHTARAYQQNFGDFE